MSTYHIPLYHSRTRTKLNNALTYPCGTLYAPETFTCHWISLHNSVLCWWYPITLAHVIRRHGVRVLLNWWRSIAHLITIPYNAFSFLRCTLHTKCNSLEQTRTGPEGRACLAEGRGDHLHVVRCALFRTY